MPHRPSNVLVSFKPGGLADRPHLLKTKTGALPITVRERTPAELAWWKPGECPRKVMTGVRAARIRPTVAVHSLATDVIQ
jgi:hypothetical protein